MSVLSTKTKARIGVKTAKQAAKHPKLALRGAPGATPVVRAAVVIVGIAVGAGAMYVFDPASGNKRRRALIGLITRNGGAGDQNAEPVAEDEAGGPAHPGPGHMPPEH